MTGSQIEWTDETFAPWFGCSRVSEECQRCYAED
jgi:protein gp37